MSPNSFMTLPHSLSPPFQLILPCEFSTVCTRSNMVKVQQSNNDSDRTDSSSSKSNRLILLKVKPKPKPKPNPKSKPLPRLQLELPIAIKYDPSNFPILTPEFFKIDALELAPLLLGKLIRKGDVVLQITEVEAYRTNDSACHGRFGITPRTAPVFGPGGHAYVYLCYGLHTMLNVVADKEGNGAAVLIRASAPVAGLKTIQQRRGQITEKPVLLTGPGKVGQALGLTTEWSNHPFYEPGGLELLDGPKPESILVGPRVGIEYASPEHISAPWRFAIAGTQWISAPKNTLSLHPDVG